MKKIVQTCNRSDPCNYLSNLSVNTVRLVIFMLHRQYRIQRPGCLRSNADMIPGTCLFNWPDANFIHYNVL